MNITVFLGAPGSGKGTQAKRLADNNGFTHFSTGDMLRAAIKQGSEVGLKAKHFIERGELVPDGIMIELIEGTLSILPQNSRVILDGFPRTVPQAEALDGKSTTTVQKAVFFDIPESALVGRLTGRRTCRNCGEPYHISFHPPKAAGKCDKCGGELVQRSDDSEEVVKKRLEVFKNQNSQLLSYYRQANKLQKLDANQPIEIVQTRLSELLQ